MSADWFLSRHLKLEHTLTAEERETLTLFALSMLRSGLSAQEWLALSPESREIFSDAGERLWIERAAILALFLKDPVKAARVLEGEDAAIEAALDKRDGVPAP